MSRRLLLLAVFACALIAGHAIAADEAHAAAGHGTDWRLLGLQALNVSVLGFILIRYARKPLNDFLKQRSLDIRGRIESAERGLASAEQELSTLRARLGQMEIEKREFIAEAEKAATAEAARHVERANETSIRIQERVVAVSVQVNVSSLDAIAYCRKLWPFLTMSTRPFIAFCTRTW